MSIFKYLAFLFKNWVALDPHSHGLGVTEVNTPYLKPYDILKRAIRN